MTSVLVADDQPLIRQAISELLADDLDLEVLGQATDGIEAIRQALVHRPDVIVMDIRMPNLDGIEATRSICADQRLSATRVLILTTFEEDQYLIQALRAGASGFIGKGAEPDDIIRAVKAIHAGDALLSPLATRNLIARFVLPSEGSRHDSTLAVPAEFSLLTERELEVLHNVGRGLSNQEIAEHLRISPHTSKTHVNRIMTKLRVHDRAQLVIIAYESGLLSPRGM